MRQPILFSIDDDSSVLKVIARDLRLRYARDYRILSTTSAREALSSLLELKNKGDVVALFISDQRMPEMEGVAFLAQTIALYPDAKRVLLTAYADTEAAVKAINEAGVDYYFNKPWDPPEEKLYPVLDDLLEDWKGDYKPPFTGTKVIGFPFSPQTHEIKAFLTSYLVPFQYFDHQQEEAARLLTLNHIAGGDLPAVFYEDGSIHLTPTFLEIAGKIGLNSVPKKEVYDVVIVGAGPAGLAAGVYGASEGLRTLLIERRSPGGQAGASSRIENYLGFPSGLSGADLTRRALAQATRFGAEFLTPRTVSSIRNKDGYKIISLDDGATVAARAVVVTTGVDYRQLETPGVAALTGAGIYYGASATEAASWAGKNVYIVGGGNSAGQSAMYLSKYARQVTIIVRKPDLSGTMSSYLIEQIGRVENIAVLPNAGVTEAKGTAHLEALMIERSDMGTTEMLEASALYIFIGAKPYTDWLGDLVAKDSKGFIETGPTLQRRADFDQLWKLDREPFLLETSCPGVFAAGDVHAGAMARVASAVGEGSMSISLVHKYLADT
jgi:thioredoxin reductase (NADPH)